MIQEIGGEGRRGNLLFRLLCSKVMHLHVINDDYVIASSYGENPLS